MSHMPSTPEELNNLPQWPNFEWKINRREIDGKAADQWAHILRSRLVMRNGAAGYLWMGAFSPTEELTISHRLEMVVAMQKDAKRNLENEGE